MYDSFATPWAIARQALQFMFPRQEYWSGLLFPSPGDLLNPGIKPMSPALQGESLPSETAGKPLVFTICKTTNFFFFSFWWLLDLQDIGSYFPGKGLNLHTWHWKYRVLTSGLPVNSRQPNFYFSKLCSLNFSFLILKMGKMISTLFTGLIWKSSELTGMKKRNSVNCENAYTRKTFLLE